MRAGPSRRVWRIGQTEPVRFAFMAYRNTLQADALKLVAKKLQSSLAPAAQLRQRVRVALGTASPDGAPADGRWMRLLLSLKRRPGNASSLALRPWQRAHLRQWQRLSRSARPSEERTCLSCKTALPQSKQICLPIVPLGTYERCREGVKICANQGPDLCCAGWWSPSLGTTLGPEVGSMCPRRISSWHVIALAAVRRSTVRRDGMLALSGTTSRPVPMRESRWSKLRSVQSLYAGSGPGLSRVWRLAQAQPLARAWQWV